MDARVRKELYVARRGNAVSTLNAVGDKEMQGGGQNPEKGGQNEGRSLIQPGGGRDSSEAARDEFEFEARMGRKAGKGEDLGVEQCPH